MRPRLFLACLGVVAVTSLAVTLWGQTSKPHSELSNPDAEAHSRAERIAPRPPQRDSHEGADGMPQIVDPAASPGQETSQPGLGDHERLAELDAALDAFLETGEQDEELELAVQTELTRMPAKLTESERVAVAHAWREFVEHRRALRGAR